MTATDTRTLAAQLVAEAEAHGTYEYLVTIAAEELEEPTSFFTTGETDAHGHNTYNWLRAAEACVAHGYTTTAAVAERGEDLRAMRWAASKSQILSYRVTVFTADGEPIADEHGDMLSRVVTGPEGAATARILARKLIDIHEGAHVANITELAKPIGGTPKHNRTLAQVIRQA